ncbi:hypothetical protein BJY16_000176 [Actinoplanes octamycinicus]|uniref:Uncharacterized protein n=1 Tax=Actinoplanes octamycinicus TaxID=135948 RepID=A0A7W7GR29_9ACTN|nr:hypothetical protein [Actinoplanes octamycinicus]MBB4736717.1 hypothetical protein [Actinoplanes octamycinicus]GIE60484.1 hypothetical protein Aoc01nite_58860 [Actinoplanes octamycinicus]
MSPVRALPAELGAVRALIAEGLAEVNRAADDPEQFWIRSAITRLAAADATLADLLPRRRPRIASPAASLSRSSAAAALSATVLVAAVTAGGAALARAAGAGPGGALTVGGTLLLLTLYLAGSVRRREPTPTPPPPPDTPGLGLIAVPPALDRARVRLVSAALRRAGPANWPVPALRRAVAADPVLDRLAHADLLLCQAIDCLDRYLDDLEKDWP